jgi:sugar phosphate isomerase/epimerase
MLLWVCSLGYAHIQVDATLAGLRPRDLDRSARRDILSLLRNRSTAVSGIDLFIPPSHFTDPTHADRAASAVRDALSLASDWSHGMTVTTALPDNVDPALAADLSAHAHRVGALLADAAWPPNALLARAIDPAAVLAAREDIVKAVTTGPTPASARLSDFTGTGRVEPGTGVLDTTAYGVALAVAGYARPLVIDLRALRDQPGAARRLRTLAEGTHA